MVLPFLLVFFLLFSGCADETSEEVFDSEKLSSVTEAGSGNSKENEAVFDLSEIPGYSGLPYMPVNDNVPAFTEEELTTASFESYGELDALGRCTAAYASVGKDLMPTKKRGSIGKVKPSGWHFAEYDNVEGESLYNRCHLIGYQLTAENANDRNLITGTRYMNTEGMLPFENMTADYIKETGNHVLYRVTPVFEGDNLVASGVQMEAMSVEDGGEGILFNVYCYNVQPGIFIDYATGDSRMEVRADKTAEREKQQKTSGSVYVLNTNTKKFHKPSCPSVEQMTEDNKEEYAGDRGGLEKMGYEPCGRCKP